ncbi:hypothetical protein PEC18_12160 [Paucibacter sp. O1-1]|nr:hypothetical protein [Paucibacter sp. O1-1]MDA3826570.1 hypothetical protein [Paucibacter sp. O1-1]
MSYTWPSPCLIVDVTDVDQWSVAPHGGKVIPVGKRPTVLVPSRALAETEAKRLAGTSPRRRFAIFEACLLATTVKVPTHITVGGAVVADREAPHLVEIDGHAPF